MMTFGDGGFGTWPIDMFGEEVDLLVTSVYGATINQIENWDREQQQRLQTATALSPDETANKAEYWNEQIAMLRCHVGNMGLVSLIAMFEHWLQEFEKEAQRVKILPDSSGGNVVKRVLRIEEKLGKGRLSSDQLDNALKARDAIVHHASVRQYYNDRTGQRIEVKEEFLSEIRQCEFQVGIRSDVLARYCDDIKHQATLWFSETQARLRRS